MSDKKIDNAGAVEFLSETSKLQGGVACVTVSDGHVLTFTRDALERFLERCNKNNVDEVIIFVKRTDGKFAS